MPYYRRKKYKYKKRYKKPYKKRYKKRGLRINSLRVRGVSTMPDMLICKMKYKATIVLASIFQNQTYSLNGLYDPDITGFGQQPMGFDQFMAFYERYEVRSSSIKLYLTNNSAAQYIVALYPSTSPTPVGNITQAGELPYSRSYTMSSQAGQATKIIKSYMTVKKIEGRALDSTNYSGSASANPSFTRYWHIAFNTLDGVAFLDARVRVEITYYARLYKRLPLSRS